MDQEQLTAVFDQQAKAYDEQWRYLEPIRAALYLVIDAATATVQPDARVLAVGPGTGVELAYFARRLPTASFLAVEPSEAMIEVCTRRSVTEGFADRVAFHHGTLESLDAVPSAMGFDVATSILVSQFFTDSATRIEYFAQIRRRLAPGATLINADLSAPRDWGALERGTRTWLSMMTGDDVSPERLDAAVGSYRRDVAVIGCDEIEQMMTAAGFVEVSTIFQAALFHAWSAAVPR